jgi:hypothetical protein
MPRPEGSKVVPCTAPKCKGKVVALPGETKICKKCGARVKVTKKMLSELGK